MVGSTNKAGKAGIKFSNMLGQFPTHPDLETVEKYVIALKEHRYNPDEYFDKKDKEIYHAVKDFFTGNNGTYEYGAVKLYSLASQYFRAITDTPVGFKEKAFAKKFKKDYLTGGRAMKAVAWIAVHAYICNSFIARSGIENMIPINHPELAPVWNQYIMSMNDVPNKVRKMFMMDEESHCEFINGIPAKMTKEDMTALCDDEPKKSGFNHQTFRDKIKSFTKISGNDQNASNSPSDNDVFDQSSIMDDPDIISISSSDEKVETEIISLSSKNEFDTKGAIDAEVKEVTEDSVDHSKEKDEYLMNMAEQVANEEEIAKTAAEVSEDDLGAKDYIQEQEDEKASVEKDDKSFVPNVEPVKEYTMGQLRDAVKFKDGNFTAAGEAPEPLTEKETTLSKENFKNEIIGKVPEYHVGADTEFDESTVNNYYAVNNDGWHKLIPGLDGFTKIIHKAGYLVQYLESQNYPGLLIAQIIDMNMNNGLGGIHKMVFIDPGWIYGDTIRMVTMERRDNDITKEIYLSKAQEKYIIKMLQTGLSKEDRAAINKELPRSIYYVINHVDLSKVNGKMRNFFQWRSLISNISTVLRSMPECRFRIYDVESQHKFKLICDQDVRCAFYNPIFYTKTHQEMVERHLYVVYDKDKYEKTYKVGTADGKELGFDPYKNYNKSYKAEKKNKKDESKEVK